MTLVQQIPTLCPSVYPLLLETGSVGPGSSMVGAIKNHLYLINCSVQVYPGKEISVVVRL